MMWVPAGMASDSDLFATSSDILTLYKIQHTEQGIQISQTVDLVNPMSEDPQQQEFGGAITSFDWNP
jgi:hypothetical protein